MDDVKDFYNKYYNPGNAILSVAGDVTTGQIRKLVEKWFGPIPRGNTPGRNYPEELPQHKSRGKTVERDVPQSAIYLCWLMPGRNDRDFYTVDLISDILSNGNSSRLFQNLVKGRKLFSELNAFVTGDVDPGLFIVSGKVLNGTTLEQSEEAILQELENFMTDISDEELQKVKNKVEANLIFSKLSVLNKAMYLGYFQMLGDAALLGKEEEKYMEVTKENIIALAGKLFRKEKQNSLFYKAVNQ